jgi:CheY-like chemotaxis protein
MSILIIDDDDGVRQLLAIFLTYKGYSAVSVTNGAEALHHLQHTPAPPELILLDLTMPVMDGNTFCHHQQRQPRLAGIPIVVLSGAADMQEQSPTLPVAACLPKPINFDNLLILVEHHCQQSRQYEA